MREEKKHIRCVVEVDGSVGASSSAIERQKEREEKDNAIDSVSLCKCIKETMKDKSDNINK